jgi:Ca2+-binding EF-hand superfamily protein
MLKIFAAAALVAALPLTASAQADKGKARKEVDQKASSGSSVFLTGFDRLDRNRDGYVSRDEAKDAPELQTRFSELDTNNDGKLSREEYDVLRNSSSGSTAQRK